MKEASGTSSEATVDLGWGLPVRVSCEYRLLIVSKEQFHRQKDRRRQLSTILSLRLFGLESGLIYIMRIKI